MCVIRVEGVKGVGYIHTSTHKNLYLICEVKRY